MCVMARRSLPAVASMTEVRSSATGRGLFTTRAFRKGERVLQEAPLAVTDRIVGMDPTGLWQLVPRAWEHRSLVEEFGECGATDVDESDLGVADNLCLSLGTDREDLVSFYRKLALIHYRADWTDQLMTMDNGDVVVLRAAVRRALYRSLSFVNHSCAPSCAMVESRDFVKVLAAREDMAAGEEVTFSYNRELMKTTDAAERQRLVRGDFGFDCCCRACV